ncbi:MAG: 50S ribosomal protein L22 [Alphaproteobacteria bacterium]
MEKQSNIAKAITKAIRISPRKLNLVAQSIRGMKADKALNSLTFSKKRVAIDVKKTLLSAIANAENNHDMDVDRLFVGEAFVGKGISLKRFRPRAKGRAGKISKPFSRLTIYLKEVL